MAIEIERRFLVVGDSWRASAGPGAHFRQGHLARGGQSSVRVRLAGGKAYLTVKGAREGIARREFEYEIPVEDALEMLDVLCLRPLLEKTRYLVEHAGLVWEVDVFSPPVEDLVVAEVELDSIDQPVPTPDWVGEEVTGDLRYRSAAIAAGGNPRLTDLGDAENPSPPSLARAPAEPIPAPRAPSPAD